MGMGMGMGHCAAPHSCEDQECTLAVVNQSGAGKTPLPYWPGRFPHTPKGKPR